MEGSYDISWAVPVGLSGRPSDTELLHSAAKCVGMEIEQASGALRALDHPVRLFEHGDNVPALHFFERRRGVG